MLRNINLLKGNLRLYSTVSKNKIGIIPGDGIGKEIMPAAVKVIEALNLSPK
eukprot:Pgem_evm1s6358